MESSNSSQLELFSQIGGPGEDNACLSGNFFCFLRRYEKIIILLVCFIITGIISYALGVEKGKKAARLIMPIDNQARIIQPAFKAVKEEAHPAQTIFEKPTVTAPQKIKEKEYIEKYTVQVATFQTKTGAQREAEALRKKGLSPLTLSKKGYTVLCVGNFPTKETAKSLLPDLKKQYRDCFIRRL